MGSLQTDSEAPQSKETLMLHHILIPAHISVLPNAPFYAWTTHTGTLWLKPPFSVFHQQATCLDAQLQVHLVKFQHKLTWLSSGLVMFQTEGKVFFLFLESTVGCATASTPDM